MASKDITLRFEDTTSIQGAGKILEGVTINATGVQIQNGSTITIGINTQLTNSDFDLAVTIIHEILHTTRFGVGFGNGEVVPSALAAGDPTAIQQYEALIEAEAQRIAGELFDGTGDFDSTGTFVPDSGAIDFENEGNNINGGNGNDHLNGQGGVDILRGGSGNDYYRIDVGEGGDVVIESGGIDRVRINGLDLDQTAGTIADNMLVVLSAAGHVFSIALATSDEQVETFQFDDGMYSYQYVFNEYVFGEQPGSGPGGPYIPDPNGGLGFPVVIDLDGDGVELVSARTSKIRMDVDGDGIRDRVGWFGPDDGVLVFDRNDNDRVDSFSEISFIDDLIGARSDLEGLLGLDSNADGVLSSTDEVWSSLYVWQDANQNGRSQNREMFTLAELGIEEIDLNRHSTGVSLENVVDNVVLNTAEVRFVDDTTATAGDVALYYEAGQREHSISGSSTSVLNEGLLTWADPLFGANWNAAVEGELLGTNLGSIFDELMNPRSLELVETVDDLPFESGIYDSAYIESLADIWIDHSV